MSTLSRREFVHAAFAVSFASQGLAADSPRVPTVLESLGREVASAPLSLKFPGGNADDCRKWQGEFASKLRELLGPFTPPKEWKKTIREATELPDHVRHDLVLTADGVPSLPVYQLLPKEEVSRNFPGILALHGHGTYGHHSVAGRDDLPGVAKSIEGANYDYGRQLARRGYAVVVPCFTPFGERLGTIEGLKGDLCGDTFIRMQELGKLLIAENLRDALWAFNLLATTPAVDRDRLGCVGLSYGGRMTMLTTALEPRIKVAVISGALNMMQERLGGRYGCGAQIIPGLLKYGDNPEIASLIAPRPVLWEVGANDASMPRKWSDEFLSRMRKAYDAFGVSDKLVIDRFDGGHRWNGAMAYPFLDKVLKQE